VRAQLTGRSATAGNRQFRYRLFGSSISLHIAQLFFGAADKSLPKKRRRPMTVLIRMTMMLIAIAGCQPPVAEDSEDLTSAATPAPFFGESVEARYVAGDLAGLSLGSDGTFAWRRCDVTPCQDPIPEQGQFQLSTSHRGTRYIGFYSGGRLIDRYVWRAGARQELRLRREGRSRWAVLRPFPDEQLCDSSGGHWRDDDVNPATGLYCDCDRQTRYWNPAAGGCVPRQ
jgi:hypothetical protein